MQYWTDIGISSSASLIRSVSFTGPENHGDMRLNVVTMF